jgi:membrane protein required for colicin V production
VNGLDLVLGCFLVFFSYRGFRKGLLREGCGLAGLILGVMVAVRFHSQLSHSLGRYFPQQSFFLGILSFILLFLACVLVLNTAGLVLNRMARVFLLSFWDHLGGTLFGFLKGAAITGLLFLVAQKYLSEELLRRQTTNSILAKPLIQVASFVIRAVEREHTPSASLNNPELRA